MLWAMTIQISFFQTSVFQWMKKVQWNLWLSTSARLMDFRLYTYNGHAYKLGILRDLIICLWRFKNNFIFSPVTVYHGMLSNILNYQVCKIVEGQRYSKRLNERQITALLKVTCQRPQQREMDILKVLLFCNIYYIYAFLYTH